MAILKWIGALLVAAGLLLWLVFEITFATVHALLLIGLASLVAGILTIRARR